MRGRRKADLFESVFLICQMGDLTEELIESEHHGFGFAFLEGKVLIKIILLELLPFLVLLQFFLVVCLSFEALLNLGDPVQHLQASFRQGNDLAG